MIRILSLTVALLLTGCASAGTVEPRHWQQLTDPAAAGWSAEKLEAARQQAIRLGSGAVMIVDSGHVVAAWGDVERRFRSHSLRKSLVSMLYGVAVSEGKIDLDSTLARFGVDDLQPLTGEEKRATVRDLLTSRSGVYHPAAKVTRGQVAKQPARGSHAPGSHWFYNNWDFNLAGVLLGQALGDPGEAFLRTIAEPAGMQDFRARDFQWEPEPRTSRYPAYDFRISARDLARAGELMRNGGTWRGRRVLPEAWITESLRPATDFGDGSGYGYMWWIGPETSREFGLSGEPSGSFAAVGAGAQIVFVLPSRNLVIVHRGNTDGGDGVDETKALELIAEIVRAKTGATSPRPALRAMTTEPLGPALLPLDDRAPVPIDAKLLAELPGHYVVTPQMTAEIYAHEGMLFLSTPGRPDLQLVQAADGSLFSRSVPLTVNVKRGSDGAINELEVSFQGRVMRGVPRRPEVTKEPADAS